MVNENMHQQMTKKKLSWHKHKHDKVNWSLVFISKTNERSDFYTHNLSKTVS
jgi:hypothetical protein